jgi:molecular chaperone DnaK (HSP70)
VKLSVDANGIMNVSAEEKTSGKTKNITITNDKGRLSKEQIEEMIKKAEQFKEEDERLKEKVEAKNGLENYLYNLKNSMTKKDDSPPVFEEVKQELDPIIEEGIKWLDDNANEETQVYKDKQKELEGKVNPLMQKLYSQAGPPPSDDVETSEDGNVQFTKPSFTTADGKPMPTVDEVD